MRFSNLPNILVIILIFVQLISPVFAQDKGTLGVLDFEGLGISENETKALTNRLRGIFVKTDEYQVIERGKMNEILDEQGFQLSGCTSDACMVEAGQLLGVKYLLAGSISLVGSTYSVEMRIINIETGEIEKSASYDMRGVIDDLLTSGMENAINILLGKEAVAPVVVKEKPKATITIKTTPADCDIIINDESKGRSPLNITDLEAETALDLKIIKEGYETFTKQITLPSGRNAPVNFTLIRQTGLLSITGAPNKTKIILNNKRKKPSSRPSNKM